MVAAYGSEAQAPRPQYVQVSPARGGARARGPDQFWVRRGAVRLGPGGAGPWAWRKARADPTVATRWRGASTALPEAPPQARPGQGALRAASTRQVRAHLGAANPQPLLALPSSPGGGPFPRVRNLRLLTPRALPFKG